MTPELYTLKEVATRLRMSERSVLRRMASGDLSHYRDGKIILVSESQIEDYLKRHAVEAKKETLVPLQARTEPTPRGRRPITKLKPL